eukprot:INCI9172.1.p1 GENE.INCI9172.1~~INCI9172.1.p1  ORF type:complete len:467 (-),score=90.61 INCI9172.1:271-1671(-)
MSGYVGSLSIDQSNALQELKEKLRSWVEKPKEESKQVLRDKEEEEHAAQAAAAALPMEVADNDAEGDSSGEGGGGSASNDSKGPELPRTVAKREVPPILKYCSNKEAEARATALIEDDDMLLRFLRARDFDVEKAYELSKNDFKWRCLVKPEAITEVMVREGLRQNLMRIAGYDKEGSPVVILVSGNWEPDKHDLDEYIRTIAYCMEQIKASMGPGVHQMTVIFDMDGWTFKRHGGGFAMKCVSHLIGIVQKHYPTFLKKAFLCNVPSFFKFAWKIIAPWIDPRTREKVFFLKPDTMGRDLLELIPADVLETTFGGEAEPGLELFHFDPNKLDLSDTVAVIRASNRPAADLPPPKNAITVPARGKHTVDVRVSPGQSIEWHAHADDKDCNIRTLFAAAEAAQETLDHALEELSSHARVGTEVLVQRTSTFSSGGVFRIEFDNTYSWMNSKKSSLHSAHSSRSLEPR